MVETVRVISAYDAEWMPGMLKISGVGAAVGFLGAVGIYFEPQEPYPGYITLAGTLFAKAPSGCIALEAARSPWGRGSDFRIYRWRLGERRGRCGGTCSRSEVFGYRERP